ncbi:MAG TPA: hypothetical protein VKZ98_11795 [Aquaticitalea sp.]|nr:hypothetical protein [Aquaticitalea sp.]
MTNHILKGISFIFHPVIMPLLGVMFYFSKTPRFIPEPIIYAKLFSVTILTLILPILIFYLLKTIKIVKTIYLESPNERILPLLINCTITILVLYRVLPSNEIEELFYFFVGILCSSLACLILAFLKFKASLHMVASAGFFMFAVALSIHFKININGTIALMCIIIGAIATSRLHLKAHSNMELLIGFFIGLIPQLFVLNYWL